MSSAEQTPGRTYQARNGNGKFVRNAETAERDAQACRLQIQGYTLEEIANELGYANRAHAREGVERALLAIVREPAEELLKIHLERLREMYRTARAIMIQSHPMVQHGKVVAWEETDGTRTPLEDPMPKLAAIDRMTRVLEREAKLLGLDAPKQVEFITLDLIQAEIRKLEADMAAREREGISHGH
jgi:hypothetical protein